MAGFVEGVDRGQSTLFPALLDDYVTEDNPVRAVDVFVDVAGYAGYYGNMELHHNINALVDGLDAFGFVDYGAVYSTFPKSVYLASVGAGLSYDTKKILVADISAGTPLTHAIPDHPNYFVYFRLTAKLSSAVFK
jgi:hemolysin activation/secretion protein